MKLVIIGAGGFGREVLQYARDAALGEVLGFLDDRPDALHGLEVGCAVLGPVDGFQPPPEARFLVAVGDPLARRRLARVGASRGWRFATLVHPTAYVAPSARLAEGVIVGPFAFVGPAAQLAGHAVLNTYASVGHDAVLGECTVLSPYAVLNGAAVAEGAVFLGTHATVQPGKRVGRQSKVAAGTVVTRDAPACSLVAGNPGAARVMFREEP